MFPDILLFPQDPGKVVVGGREGGEWLGSGSGVG
jgi:hypothetical protein